MYSNKNFDNRIIRIVIKIGFYAFKIHIIFKFLCKAIDKFNFDFVFNEKK